MYRVTAAPRAHSDDQQARIRRYLVSMSIRTVCVILAVAVGGPLRWVFALGAVLLPYIAVVMANAAGAPHDPVPAVLSPGRPPGPTPAGADPALPPVAQPGITRTDDP